MDGFGGRLRAGSRRGSAVVEYGILAGLVAVVTVGAVSTLGGKVEESFSTTTAQLETAPMSSNPSGAGSTGSGPTGAEETPSPEEEGAPEVDYTLGIWSLEANGFNYGHAEDGKIIAPEEGVEISNPSAPTAYNPNTNMVYGVDVGGVGRFYRAHVEDATLEVFGSAHNFDFGGMHYSANTDRLLLSYTGRHHSAEMSGHTSSTSNQVVLAMINPDTGAMHQLAAAEMSEVVGGMNDYESGSIATVTASDADGVDITISPLFGSSISVRYDYVSDTFTRQ